MAYWRHLSRGRRPLSSSDMDLRLASDWQRHQGYRQERMGEVPAAAPYAPSPPVGQGRQPGEQHSGTPLPPRGEEPLPRREELLPRGEEPLPRAGGVRTSGSGVLPRGEGPLPGAGGVRTPGSTPLPQGRAARVLAPTAPPPAP